MHLKVTSLKLRNDKPRGEVCAVTIFDMPPSSTTMEMVSHFMTAGDDRLDFIVARNDTHR
jgi:hypothetical protein